MSKSSRAGRNSGISFEAVNSRALRMLPLILHRWLPGGTMRRQEFIARNPRRTDNRPGSFSINVRTGRWADFATGDRGGDVISLAAYLFGLSQAEACQKVAEMLGVRHDRR